MFWNSNKRIYLDHASTTPLDPNVFEAMNQVYKNNYFNPGGLYAEGVLVAQKILECRKSVAKILGTTSEHVVFTRGGTESCNLAVLGVLKRCPLHGRGLGGGLADNLPHVITSEIEHSAILETLKDLQNKNQIELSIIPVDEDGVVQVDEIKKALRPETVLVSIMYVNNEIGTIQPIKEIAKLIRWYKKQKGSDILPFLRGGARGSARAEGSYPIFHTDAIQATNYLDIHVDRLGVDLMSLSGSKIYGPKSSGILYVRNRDLVSPVFHGGEQEFGLRAGTEDVAQIVGFTKALEMTREISDQESARLKELQNYFFEELEKNLKDFKVNGAFESPLHGRGLGGGLRIPNNINISISGIPSERLVIELDAKGICASSKSACREESGEESYVIAALRKGEKSSKVEGSVRFTMGKLTVKKDIQKGVKILAKIVHKIRVFDDNLTK